VPPPLVVTVLGSGFPGLRRCDFRGVLLWGDLHCGGRRLARVGVGILRVLGRLSSPFGGALRHQLVLGDSHGVGSEGRLIDGVDDVEAEEVRYLCLFVRFSYT